MNVTSVTNYTTRGLQLPIVNDSTNTILPLRRALVSKRCIMESQSKVKSKPNFEASGPLLGPEHSKTKLGRSKSH